MVMKKVKEIKTEKIEKRGHVFNASETFEILDKLALKETRDFGQVDLTDHQVEQAMERDRKQNEAIWKNRLKKSE